MLRPIRGEEDGWIAVREVVGKRWGMRIVSVTARALVATAAVALVVGAASGGGVRATITASDVVAGDGFATAGALDGDTAVVGAASQNVSQGAAYVFVRSGSAWTQQAKLAASDGAAFDRFATSVALSGDTVLAGAGNRNVGQGAVYVFTRAATTWTLQSTLTASDAVNSDHLGTAVASSGDTAAASAAARNTNQGAVYVFTRSGTTWTQQATLTAADGVAQDYLGGSLALDGDTIVAGAYNRSSSRGAAYVFTRTGTVWTQQAVLVAADGAAQDLLGFSVAVAGDTAVVGAVKNSGHGAAYVFKRSGTTWTQQAKLEPSTGNDQDGFGVSVAIQNDRILVGAAGRDGARGLVYVFARTGTVWSQRGALALADAAANDYLGTAVALSGDTALVCAPGKTAAYAFAGQAQAPPPNGYCLPKKVKATANAASPAKSTLTASGVLDFGTGVPDLSGAATFDVGGFHLDVPAFVVKGKSLTYSAGGVSLTIAQPKPGTAHSAFTVKATGDLTGKVAAAGSLAFHFQNAAHDLAGAVTLKKGAIAPHGLTAPGLYVSSATATAKGGGKDTLKLTLGFASDGVVPATAEPVTLCFGDAFVADLASGWIKKGDAWTRTKKAPGVTKASVDHVKGLITITASGVDLGPFAAGVAAATITVVRGTDVESVGVRMSHAGTKLTY